MRSTSRTRLCQRALQAVSDRNAPERKLAAMPRTTRIKQTYISPLGKINALLARIRTDHATPLSDTDHTEVLHILADDRRRYAIEYLTSNPTGMCVPLSDLVDVAAAMENDCLIKEVASI